MIILLAFLALFQPAADTLSIQDCYRAVEQNFPTSSQLDLQDEIARLGLDNLRSGSLPTFQIGGQAIYYSEVASLPGPDSPSAPKDQYKLSLTLEQAIYDGGLKSSQRSVVDLQSEIEKAKVHTNLFRLREQVNASFMGALIYDAQIATLDTISAELNARLADVTALVENGVVLPSSIDVLKVELLKNEQRLSEARSARESMRAVLARLTGLPVDTETVLSVPSPSVSGVDPDGRRQPEYRVLDLSRELLQSQSSLIAHRRNPQVGAFAETAYGRPAGLNLFASDLAFFYTLGLRMRWTPWDWRINDREREIVDVRTRIVDTEEEALSRNFSMALEKQTRAIARLEEQIGQDREIIVLRERITAEAASRLSEGVLTATQYITEVNAESQARQAQALHLLQLVHAKLDYLTTLGVEP